MQTHPFSVDRRRQFEGHLWEGETIYRDLINRFLFEPAATKAAEATAAATAHTGSVSIGFPRQPSPDQLVRI